MRERAHMVDINALPGQFYGLEVRRLRESHGWTQVELGERIGYSGATVSYVENAHNAPTARFTRACDTAFDTGTYLSRLRGLARNFAVPSAPLGELLGSATSLQIADPLLVPSLVQTDDYARAAMAASCLPDDTVGELLACRVRLGDLLECSPELRAWLVVDEASLYRPVGNRETLRLQLKELIALIETGRVIVQVLKTTSPMVPLMRVPQVIMGFADGTNLVHLPDLMPDGQTELYGPVEAHVRAFDLLRAAAMPPGISQGMIATATR